MARTPLLNRDALINAENAQDDPNKTTIPYSELQGRAWGRDSSIAHLERRRAEHDFMINDPHEPEYEITQEKYDEVVKDIPDYLRSNFGRAQSDEHADRIASDLRILLQENDLIASQGARGVLATLSAAVGDPVNLIPLVGAPKLAVGATKLARGLRLGLIGIGEGVAAEAIIQQAGTGLGRPEDLLYAGVGGFVVGGAFGAILGKTKTQQIQLQADELELVGNLMYAESIGAKLTPSGEALLAKVRGDGSLVATDAEVAELHAILNQGREGSTGVGADEASPIDHNLTEYDDDFEAILTKLEEGEVGASSLGILRKDLTGRLLQHPDPLIRGLGGVMAEDSVMHKGVNYKTASELQNLLHKTTSAEYYRDFDVNYKEYAKNNGIPWLTRGGMDNRAKFATAVGQHMRGTKVSKDKNVIAHAKKQSELYAKRLKVLKESGVKGFDDIPEDPNFLPRHHESGKLLAFTTKYGDEGLVAVVAHSLRKAIPELDDVKLNKIARGYTKVIQKVDADINQVSVYHGMDIEGSEDVIRQIMREADIPEGDIEDILTDLISNAQASQVAKPKTGVISTAKRRLNLDESARLKIRNIENNQMEDAGFADILDDNVEALWERYNRVTSGHAAIAEATGLKSPQEFDNLIKRIKDRNRNDKTGRTKDAVNIVTAIYNHTVGRSLEKDPDGNLARTARLLRSYNYARVGGQFGQAQLAEIGNGIGQVGLRAMLQSIPEFGRMWKLAKDGKLADDAFREIEEFIGTGTDYLRNPLSTRPDDLGYTGKWGWVDDSLQYAGRFVSVASGMAPINAGMHRFFARGMAHKITNLAFKKELSPKDLRRLEALDIDDKMAERIFEQIRLKSSFSKGLITGRKLRTFNPDSWDDAGAREALRFAIHRKSRQIIQENDIGGQFLWMQGSVGKSVVQFRTFAQGAFYKQTLRSVNGIKEGDFSYVISLMFSMMITSMVYMGGKMANYKLQEAIGGITKKDREKYEDDMSWRSIGTAAAARTGQFSLIPLIYDSVANATGGTIKPQFSGTRISEQASGAFSPEDILGNPTSDAATKFFEAFQIPFKIADPEKTVTQNQARRVASLVPPYKVLGVQQIMNSIADSMVDLQDNEDVDR